MSPCRAASTRPSPPRCWPKRATTLSVCRCSSTTSATASRATAAAAASTTCTTPAASPGASNIPHYIVNFEREFQRTVVSNFVDEYVAGRTPIPCAHCNSDLKFATLLDRSMAYGAEVGGDRTLRAHRHRSGNRAPRASPRPRCGEGSVVFSVLADAGTAVARELPRRRPVEGRGSRRRAPARALPVAEKPDSQEICFVPDGDYAAFIERKTGDLDSGGAIVSQSGEVLGQPRRRAPLHRRPAQGARHRRRRSRCMSCNCGRRKRPSSSARAPSSSAQPDRISGELDCRRTARQDRCA